MTSTRKLPTAVKRRVLVRPIRARDKRKRPGISTSAAVLIVSAAAIVSGGGAWAQTPSAVRMPVPIAIDPGNGPVPRPTPSVAAGRQPRSAFRTLDEMFAAVAARVPQFGGMYVAPDQTLQVALTDVSPAAVDAARQAVTEIFGAERVRGGGFNPVAVKYGFAQLHEMR